MTRAMSAAFVLRPATHTLFYINSRCKQARQFSDGHTLAMPFNARTQVVHRSIHRTLGSCDIHVRNFVPGGAVKYEMDTGVRPALRQAGAFGESTGSKNEGSLGESMIFGIRWQKNTKIWGLSGQKSGFGAFGERNLAFGEQIWHLVSEIWHSVREKYKKSWGLWVRAHAIVKK